MSYKMYIYNKISDKTKKNMQTSVRTAVKNSAAEIMIN